MQATPVLSICPTFKSYTSDEFAGISGELSEDFSGKLNFNVAADSQTEKPINEESTKDHTLYEMQLHPQPRDETLEGDKDDDDDDYEFSFFCTDPDAPPNSAEDIFCNGEIRPMFPIFNRDLLFAGGEDGDLESSSDASSLRSQLRKLFVKEHDTPSTSSSGTGELDEEPVGAYCAWSGKAVKVSAELSKKSNSTGFSKLWRFRSLLKRSSSAGEDAFVFLNSITRGEKTNQGKQNVEKTEKVEKNVKIIGKSEVSTGSGKLKVVGGKVKGETASSSAELHYLKNRALKGGDRHKSYLPYRQDLVGFFTNVNVFSKNVHPY